MQANQRNSVEQSTAEIRRASGRDTIGHSSVQPWSAGELFPAVVGVVERYRTDPTAAELFVYGDVDLWLAHASLESRLESRSFSLTLDGHTEEYATLADAESVARALLTNPADRAQWSRRAPSADVVLRAVAAASLEDLALFAIALARAERERAPVKKGAGPAYGAGFLAYRR